MLSSKIVNNFNQVVVPLFELDTTGTVKPNTLFHRPWDKLHSRCIEYPFAASQVGDAQCILDVGTVKSDPVWISWLESLPIEVHATDYDPPFKSFERIVFHQADVRKLSIPDETFDKVLAISVIEHIGLQSPQVLSEQIPEFDSDGDLEAVRELARVLKPGGELVMTFPFGIKDELILGGGARNYTINSIQKFENILKPVKLEYYEYQHKFNRKLYEEYFLRTSIRNIVTENIVNTIERLRRKYVSLTAKTLVNNNPGLTQKQRQGIDGNELPGVVAWRKIEISQASALHSGHVEGVICGIWQKV